MGGTKFSIKTQLCPESCDACEDVLTGGDDDNDGCKDQNLKISGMTCRQAAARGHCGASTSLGNLGRALCPRSCGMCPPRPSLAASGAKYTNPTPKRSFGARPGSLKQEEQKPEIPADDGMSEEEEQEKEDQEESAAEDVEEEKVKEDRCSDDMAWSDADHDNCEVYGQYIKDG